MTTMVFSAAGAAIGGAVGGSLLGLSSVAIGRFAGALMGNAIDQRILGQGADAVETGKVDRYRISGTAEGQAVAHLYGRMRLSGQVIWATRFKETVTSSGGGKGAPSAPKKNSFSYSLSMALALCEGEITGVTRLWANGREVSMADLNIRVYRGTSDQMPDPKIEAVEGLGQVPAYRGTAYVVFEDLDLSPYGNRIPQFSFEVSRPSPFSQHEANIEPTQATQAVALMPGTGEYALATEPVFYENPNGASWAANVNSPSQQPDFLTAMDALEGELPNCEAVSLIVSWFGDDLRCGECLIKPKVEKRNFEGSLPWVVAGRARADAEELASIDGRPDYGGTPADATVLQAIAHLNEQGKAVMYYPFILMEQLANNGLPDPWSDAQDQAILPWRGRISTAKAPGVAGSSDQSATAEAEVDAFFGTAVASDFTVSNGEVTYSGPAEWRYNRFILHQAALCAAAGGVDSFCIGSEMRGLTWIRGTGNAFVAVQRLKSLAAEARAILGPDVKIGYAADWSEYFGYQPQDGSGDRFFHLDPLWADPNIDFIGIDNYMPLSDWRGTDGEADAAWGSIYNLDYLKSNIEGGEGYDWYYHSEDARDAQIRTDITDGAESEPWVYRYKDVRNWWLNAHHERIGGVRQSEPTDWEPQSKPIWFTEIGCAAIDKGTNQPNKFLDPKSSESKLPRYSNGLRDEFIQTQYLKAMYDYWADPQHNPLSKEYEGHMLDMSRAFVWAWDARPFPRFPRNVELWSDGENYSRGHWISGRTTHRTLQSVVSEMCDRAGVTHYDVKNLHGMVRGYFVNEVGDMRKALQPLMLQYGFDAVDRDGVLTFLMRGASPKAFLEESKLSHNKGQDTLERKRAAEAEISGRMRLTFVEALGDFGAVSEEAVFPAEDTHAVSRAEVNVSLLRGEGRLAVERWLAEARVARDTISFSLPMSQLDLAAGDVVEIESSGNGGELYRIDRIEQGIDLAVEATRVEPSIYEAVDFAEDGASLVKFTAAVPVSPIFMDIPLIRGDEIEHSPYVVISSNPWPGDVAIYSSATDEDYSLNTLVEAEATVGVTETAVGQPLFGRLDHGQTMRVRLFSGALESLSKLRLLNGGNAAAIGDGTKDNWEIFQFQTATLVAPDTYELSGLIRGQLGSENIGMNGWPEGSRFVLLDGIPEQLDLQSSQRGLERHYRIGPADRAMDDATYVYREVAFAGNGLRPYSPVHLRSIERANGDVDLNWIRRTRIDGDSWEGSDVPLGEEQELYHISVFAGGERLREANVTSPNWTYTSAMRASDGSSGLTEIRVAQLSARFGYGTAARHILSL